MSSIFGKLPLLWEGCPSDEMQPTLVTEWIQESKGVSSSSSISQLLPHPQRSAKARGSLRIDPLPGYQSEVNDTHHARSRNLSPSRVISRLRGNTRYSICCLSQPHNHMLHARILHLVRQP